ncbi:MAG: thiolase family protein [Deltaproteobacteria bacterium]|nr:thiolase family protein [Deltaproteobacteria bacterium]MBI3387804.1 thiolase family protein [Deltaproteobacteria bacterium]
MRDVAVLGVGMYRFGMYYDVSNATMAREAGMAALRDAGLSFRDVNAAYVGHIFAQVMSGVRVMKEFGLTGIPVQRIENASATGSAAFREACLQVAAGHADVVMVLGFDKMTTMIQQSTQGTAPENMEDAILPAGFFALWATRRMHERGMKAEHLAKIAAKNFNNGALNPMAQRQADTFITPEKVLGARMVAWPLTTMMSCPMGDGAACAIVGRADLAKKLRPDRPVVRVTASDLQSEKYARGHLFMGPVVGPAQMTIDTSKNVYEEAGVGPSDLDLVQVHDAFAIEELEYYELLGLCKVGEAEKCIEQGDFERDGRVAVSTDGGLIARGHPGGPTGLAQIWETTLQLRGEAGKRQVENARIGLCHMMGGGSVCVIHILQRD